MTWQPVHVLYGGAHLFRPGLARRAGQVALQALDAHGYPLPLSPSVEEKLRRKLHDDPVEDFRIDFEDGYGARSGEEEDAHARAAGEIVATGHELPRRIGIRVRAFTPETETRARRTLELFLDAASARLPAGFVVTLPKITSPSQVKSLLAALAGAPAAKIELMIETPQALRNLPAIIDSAEGRCAGAHFGAYDYMAACGIGFAGQNLRHAVCDFARATMQMHLADRGVPIADGVTNLIPAGDRASVHEAWRTHSECVRHALLSGIYQGWDIHPAQLVSRYAAIFDFYAEFAEPAALRLKNFLERERKATRIGAQFDDDATVAGLRNFFDRAVACGAIAPSEAQETT